MGTRRENWMDIAKLIAIIAIITGHVGGSHFSFTFSYNVTAFLILSGITLKKKDSIKDFINQKFNRLMIPYFMTCVVIMLIDLFNNVVLFHESFSTVKDCFAIDIVRSFFASGTHTNFGEIELGGRIGAIWFLPALFFALLFFQLMLHWTEDIKKLGLASILISLIGFITGKFIWFPFSIQSGMFSVFFIWVGYAANRYKLFEKIKWYHALGALVVFIIGAIKNLSGVYVVTAYTPDLLISPVVSLCACLIIIYLSRLLEKINWLGYLGQLSMTILCLHLISLETLGAYFYKVLDILKVEGNAHVAATIILYNAYAIIGAVILNWLKDKPYALYKRIAGWKSAAVSNKVRIDGTVETRDRTVDIMKGLLIVAMLIGHFGIDPTLRKVIYSCHMEAFVLLSGYFYSRRGTFGKNVLHMLKTFILPYGIYVVLQMLSEISLWSGEYFLYTIKTYILGMSFSDKILVNVDSVGVVYFILMLFLVRLIYMAIDRLCGNEIVKAGVILVLTAVGIFLGNKGLWLPWSLDCALYSLLFYYIGTLFKKYRIFELVRDNHIFYFLLSPIWAYMIYMGAMEIAKRHYAPYGVVILGALSGILIIYRFSAYINRALVLSSRILNYLGKASIVILIVHKFLNDRTIALLNGTGMNKAEIMIICIVSQIVIAAVVYGIISKMKKGIKAKA